MTARQSISVVGINDNGCVGLSSRAMNAVVRASVLAGGERHPHIFP